MDLEDEVLLDPLDPDPDSDASAEHHSEERRRPARRPNIFETLRAIAAEARDHILHSMADAAAAQDRNRAAASRRRWPATWGPSGTSREWLPLLTYLLVLSLATTIGSLVASPSARFVHGSPSARPQHNVTAPPPHAQGAQVVQLVRFAECQVNLAETAAAPYAHDAASYLENRQGQAKQALLQSGTSVYQWFVGAWPSLRAGAEHGWATLTQHDADVRATGRLLTDVALAHADRLAVLSGEASQWALGNPDTLRAAAEAAGSYFNASWDTGESGVRALGSVAGGHLAVLVDAGLWAVDVAGAHADQTKDWSGRLFAAVEANRAGCSYLPSFMADMHRMVTGAASRIDWGAVYRLAERAAETLRAAWEHYPGEAGRVVVWFIDHARDLLLYLREGGLLTTLHATQDATAEVVAVDVAAVRDQAKQAYGSVYKDPSDARSKVDDLWNTYLTTIISGSFDLWNDARALVEPRYMDQWEHAAAVALLDVLEAAQVNLTAIIHDEVETLSIPGFVKSAIEKIVGDVMDDPEKLLDALHTLMKFKSYIPVNKIVSKSLRSANFYDQAENVFVAVRVAQAYIDAMARGIGPHLPSR